MNMNKLEILSIILTNRCNLKNVFIVVEMKIKIMNV